jgi:hypothetical protein
VKALPSQSLLITGNLQVARDEGHLLAFQLQLLTPYTLGGGKWGGHRGQELGDNIHSSSLEPFV